MDKVGIFIDGGYISKVQSALFPNIKIDFGKMQEYITQDYNLFRTYYYICPPFHGTIPTSEENDRLASYNRFIYNIRKISHFEIREGVLVEREERYEQKGVDVMLAIDVVRNAWNKTIQRAVIIAGDRDFVPVIKDVKDAGVVVSLYYSNYACAQELIDVCDERNQIDESMIRQIMLSR